MPSWGIHLAIAKKINPYLNINKNAYIFGNILPDINNGYVIKEVSKKIKHEKTHYKNKENKKAKGYEEFFEKYIDKMNNPLVIGALTHLLSDYYYNNIFYSKKGIKNEKDEIVGTKLIDGRTVYKKPEEITKMKTHDFKVFSKYIYINKMTYMPIYNKNLELKKDIIE